MEPIPGLGEHKKLSEDKVGGSTVSGAVGAEVVMPQFRARRECSDLPRGGWFSDFLLDKMRSLGYPNLGCSEQRRPMRLHPSSR